MILRRLGNKSKIAKEIQKHFPPHKIYIEPFFGAGGMFFNKPKAKHNFLNDIDEDVVNLFQVVMDQKEKLVEAFKIMPEHQGLMDYWNKNKETDPIKKALRFLLLSNFGFMGKPETLHLLLANSKMQVFKKIDKTFEHLFNTKLSNKDFRLFIKSVFFRDYKEKNKSLIYCDPPYLNTTNNYSQGFTKKDSLDLFDALEKKGTKWAMSEFDHPFILDQAKKRNLNIIKIGERKNLKNRRTEILITNYKRQQQKLF